MASCVRIPTPIPPSPFVIAASARPARRGLLSPSDCAVRQTGATSAQHGRTRRGRFAATRGHGRAIARTHHASLSLTLSAGLLVPRRATARQLEERQAWRRAWRAAGRAPSCAAAPVPRRSRMPPPLALPSALPLLPSALPRPAPGLALGLPLALPFAARPCARLSFSALTSASTSGPLQRLALFERGRTPRGGGQRGGGAMAATRSRACAHTSCRSSRPRASCVAPC